MTRRDDVGEVLEGDGAEDTLLDGNGDNTGDAGDRYRGSFSLAPRPQNRPQGSRWISGSRRRPDPDDDQGESPAWDDRRTQREIAQLVTGGDGSHSRTDPDLLGLDLGGSGLSAEEAALHVTELPPRQPTD